MLNLNCFPLLDVGLNAWGRSTIPLLFHRIAFPGKGTAVVSFPRSVYNNKPKSQLLLAHIACQHLCLVEALIAFLMLRPRQKDKTPIWDMPSSWWKERRSTQVGNDTLKAPTQSCHTVTSTHFIG